jgi:hypothetical protein
MAVLKLRDAHQRGLKKLWALSDSALAEIASGLEAVPLAWRGTDLAEEVAPNIPTVSREDLNLVIEVLTGLYSVVASVDIPLDIFIDDVYEAAEEAETVRLSPDDQTRFKSRLAELFNKKVIQVAAKARLVFIEHEHYLCYARIMSDIRPVFGDDVSQPPMAAMVVHTLKLGYHVDDNVKEFFVALDPSSLERLSDLIERAKAKQKTLESVLEAANVHHLDASAGADLELDQD